MEQVKEGVWNLVRNCAEVKKGDSVLVLNEYDRVNGVVADLITEAVRQTGAEYHVMWGGSIERGRSSLPKVLVGALLSADKVIYQYGINRVLLDEHLREQRCRPD